MRLGGLLLLTAYQATWKPESLSSNKRNKLSLFISVEEITELLFSGKYINQPVGESNLSLLIWMFDNLEAQFDLEVNPKSLEFLCRSIEMGFDSLFDLSSSHIGTSTIFPPATHLFSRWLSLEKLMEIMQPP